MNCRCGVAAVTRTVQKDGPNKGRLFWACPNKFGTDENCNFFEWADDTSGGGGGGGEKRGTKRAAPGKTGGRLCSICRQPGHNKNKCPNG